MARARGIIDSGLLCCSVWASAIAEQKSAVVLTIATGLRVASGRRSNVLLGLAGCAHDSGADRAAHRSPRSGLLALLLGQAWAGDEAFGRIGTGAFEIALLRQRAGAEQNHAK